MHKEGEAGVFKGQTEVSRQCVCQHTRAEVEDLGSDNICQMRFRTCEISRRVKTNRASSCDGGAGWEMYTLMYGHINTRRREERKKCTEETLQTVRVHIPKQEDAFWAFNWTLLTL